MVERFRVAARAAALVIGFAMVLPVLAAAQSAALPDLPRPGERGKGGGNRGPADEHPTPSLPTAARVPWPRLDIGAILCKTRDDLTLEAAVMQARSSGQPYSGALPNCRVLGAAVAIDIVTRESPAATEVKLRDPPGGTGWTNTWLPSQPPRS